MWAGLLLPSLFPTIFTLIFYKKASPHQASLDEPTAIVMMHRTEPTRLQSLALQLADKVGSLVDNNERVMEIKQGNYFFNKNSKYMWLVNTCFSYFLFVSQTNI